MERLPGLRRAGASQLHVSQVGGVRGTIGAVTARASWFGGAPYRTEDLQI